MAPTQHDIASIADRLGGLATVSDQHDLDELVELVEAYFQHAEAADHLELWFRFLERFPDEDGFGGFWSILHGIERYPGCDWLAVDSVRRRPSRFPVLMLNRMLNVGIRRVAGVDLLGLLQHVAQSPDTTPGVREDAARFHAYQRAKP